MMQMVSVVKEVPPEVITVAVVVMGRIFVGVGGWVVTKDPEGAN